MADTPAVSTQLDGHIATVMLRRPPHNDFEMPMVQGVAEALDAREQCRAIVLGAEGKSFCAGADLAELKAQMPQFRSEDFRERFAAAKARRQPVFKGR
jgi:enoyl-CoA hydratase/carnithine racemase